MMLNFKTVVNGEVTKTLVVDFNQALYMTSKIVNNNFGVVPELFNNNDINQGWLLELNNSDGTKGTTYDIEPIIK